jgi:hypothetical protein
MGSSVAGLTQGDYRMDGKMELITCASDGEGGSDLGGISVKTVDEEPRN